MRRALVVVGLIFSCSALQVTPDAGLVATAGGRGSLPGGGGAGGEGGTGGGGGGIGCGGLTGVAGGLVAPAYRLSVSSPGDPDGGRPFVRSWLSFFAGEAPDGPGVELPLLAGVPVALAGPEGNGASVTALLEGAGPIQTWGGVDLVCDAPGQRASPSSVRGRALDTSWPRFGTGRALMYLSASGVVVLPGEDESRTFSTPGVEIRDFAYDRSADRLFAARPGGVDVWLNALTRPAVGPVDFTLTQAEFSQVEFADRRLYASNGSGTISVWDQVTTMNAPVPPTFVLDAGAASTIRHHKVRGGTLLATLADRVLVYRDFAAADAGRAPDLEVMHPSLVGCRKANLIYARGDRVGDGLQPILVVLTAQGVAVFENALTTPTYRRTLLPGVMLNDMNVSF